MTSVDALDNNAFEPNGICLSIREPGSIALPIPPKQAEANTSILIEVSVSNHTTTSFYLNPNDKLIPELVTSNGQALSAKNIDEQESQVHLKHHSSQGWGFNLTFWLSYLTRFFRQKSTQELAFQNWLINPEEGAVIYPTIKLYWQDKQLNFLLIKTECFYSFFKLEKSWLFERLEPQIYQLRFRYESFRDNKPNSEPKTLQLTTQLVNLSLIETREMSDAALEVDGIRFETLIPESELPIPTVSEKQKVLNNLRFFLRRPLHSPLPFTKVQIGMRITNNTSEPLRFSFYNTLIPEFLEANGQIQRGSYLSNLLKGPIESDFSLCDPFKSVTFFPQVILSWQRNGQFLIKFSTGDGGYCFFKGLNLETYQLRFSYKKLGFSLSKTTQGWELIEKRFSERVWTGRADTPFIKFRLVAP
jgi:hypothetical protein